MKKVYVLYTVKGGDGFEEVFPTMEDTIQAGLEVLRGKGHYTQAIALELDEEFYLKYLDGELEGCLGEWLGDYATDVEILEELGWIEGEIK